MTLIECNKPKRPVSLRAISLTVVFIYLFTSVDIQLAFSYTSAAPIPLIQPAKVSPKDEVSDVHYVQDFDWGETLQPAQEVQDTRQAKSPEALPDSPPAEIGEKESIPTSFFQANNPLKRQEGDLLVEEDSETGTKKFSYKNGSYFKADARTGTIVEIGDFSQEDPQRIQVQKFYYERGERGNFLTTELTAQEGSLDTFYKYKLDETGAPVQLLRYGVVVPDGTSERRRVVLREYDGSTVSIFNPLDASAKQVWELDAQGEASRLLAYEGRGFSYRLEYEDDRQQVNVKDQSGKTFVYQLIEGRKFGNLLAVKESTEDGLRDKFQVELTSMVLEGGDKLETFTFRKIEDPDQMIIRENVGGAPGRLLYMKVREADGSWTHKEFVYGDGVLTVLDFISGTYVKMEYADKSAVPDPDFWTAGVQVTEFGTLINAQTRETKVQMTRSEEGYQITGEDGSVWTYERLIDQRMGNLIHLRGPPDAQGNTVEIRYTYDLSANTRTAFNLSDFTYQTALFTDGSSSASVEEGSFAVSPAGEFLKTPTKTSEQVLKSYRYDALEAFSFEAAFELLSQDGVAVAVIVESLSESQLQQILSIPHEVGIAVLRGQIVLFTSGNDYELSVLKAFGDVAAKAQLMAHTHPNSMAGPSQADFDGAGKLEYVINRLGVYGYDQDGLRFEEGEYGDFLKLLESAKAASPQGVNEKVQASVDLNLFISGMDLFTGLPEEFKESYRADEPVGDALIAYIVAQGALESRLGVDRSNFVRGTITQAQDGLYEVPLTYQGRTYIC